MTAREQATEAALQRLNLTADRVTPEMVDRAIQKAEYTILQDGRTTICLITLDNGFTVRGESSCVNASNFNAEFGQRAAYDDARRHVWAFLAFRIAERRALLTKEAP